MIGAEARHCRQIGQGQSIIQIGFDVIPHPLQALAGKPFRRFEQESRLIGKTARNLHRKCRIQCIGEDPIDETAIDLVGNRGSYLGNQRIAESILRLDIDGPAAHQFGGRIVLDLKTLQNSDKPAAGQIAP